MKYIEDEYNIKLTDFKDLNLYEKILSFFKRNETITRDWGHGYITKLIIKRVKGKILFVRYYKGSTKELL